ncbi:MAG TPA: phosphate ABC transporter permease subunit PstC [Nitrososphaerales archaeon]|nr:phosphate ABC transporter permease subunit PstC [Nitrososphaerales archaeon]
MLPGSRKRRNNGDSIFRFLVLIVASALTFLVLLYFYELLTGSSLTLKLGTKFVTGSTWDPLRGVFGALPMLYGSLVTSAIGLLIGVPISLGVAVFVSEISPRRLRFPIGFLVELLAAVPSVVYGLWGLFIFAPFLKTYLYPYLQQYLGFLPIFQGQIYGVSVLTAGIILAIMIIPIISAISRDALLAVPDSQREAAYALGATRSEAINSSVLSYARSGIIAAIFLGFGRAFGETMAVTFLIGNSPVISSSLFSPGYTLASLIANEFTEATTQYYVSALIEAGLVLLAVSFTATFLARFLIRRLIKEREASTYL